MTFDLGLRYEYTPPWLDKNGTLMNASIPFHDTTPNVQDLSRHPVLVRIGSGDVYEDTVLRFAPNIQVARDGRLGDRLIFDDKKNFAPRFGWAWNPSEKWSFRAGTGIFYMQDTGNPRFDMARNLSGRRRDNTLLLTPDLTFDAPFRGGSGTANDCGVAPPLVCLTNVYVLGNMPDRKTPYMFQYLFNVQRELGGSTALEVGYLGSHSYRLERMFDWNETIPGLIGIGAEPEAVSRIHEGPGNRQRRRGQVQLAGGQADPPAPSTDCRCLAATRSPSPTDNGSGIRTLNGDTLFPQNSFCLDCEWGLSVFDVRHRFVASILYELPFGNGKPFLQDGVGGAILGGWQISTILNEVERISENGLLRHRPVEYRRRPGSSERDGTGSGSAGRPADDRAVVQHRRLHAECVGHLGQRRPQHVLRSRHHQRRRVDHPELPDGQQDAAVPARGVQRVEQPDLERPEHDDDQRPLYGTINSTRKPMREVQLGVKFVF